MPQKLVNISITTNINSSVNMAKSTTPTRENFWIQNLKTLTPCYAVPTMFTLLSSFCMRTKNLTNISQITSNNLISCCKSHPELCPLKTATAKTSWELYRFYQCFPYYTLCNFIYIYIYIYIITKIITIKTVTAIIVSIIYLFIYSFVFMMYFLGYQGGWAYSDNILL